MPTCTIEPAKDQLSRLVDAAVAGATVKLTRRGNPGAGITPIARKPRPLTPEDADDMARKRLLRRGPGRDSVPLAREMRDG